MDTRIVVGILILFVVAFFGYQWWRHTPTKAALSSHMANPSDVGKVSPNASATNPVANSVEYPVVAGQTEKELRAKEPLQDTKLAHQEPVSHEGHAPAEFESNLTHPEQSFHQPSSPVQHPTMTHHDVESGRAVSHPSSPSSGEQGFFPEMAQNDGPLVGNVYAFDGMEQSGFSSF